MDERIDSFLEILDTDKGQTSTLMKDFSDFYFHYHKTEISKSDWERLFYGGAKFKGLFGHVKLIH